MKSLFVVVYLMGQPTEVVDLRAYPSPVTGGQFTPEECAIAAEETQRVFGAVEMVSLMNAVRPDLGVSSEDIEAACVYADVPPVRVPLTEVRKK